MLSRSFIIASFIVVTLLTVGGGELLCRKLGSFLAVPERTSGVAPQTLQKGASATAGKQAVPSAQKNKAQPKEDYAIINQRSLFGKVQPKAKPVEKKVELPPEPIKETKLKLVLRGTIGGADNAQRAIIQDRSTNKQELYYKGDAIGKAIIKKVSRGEVILTVDGKDEILRMEEAKSAAGVATGKTLSFKKRKVTPPPPEVLSSIEKAMAAKKKNKKKYSPSATYPRRRLTFKSTKKQETDK